MTLLVLITSNDLTMSKLSNIYQISASINVIINRTI